MEIEVSIDKLIDYKDVPHSAFLRVFMVGVQKYKVKMKIYSGTHSYELHIRKSDDVYIHLYFKNFRETEGLTHTLRFETRQEHCSHFGSIPIVAKAKKAGKALWKEAKKRKTS